MEKQIDGVNYRFEPMKLAKYYEILGVYKRDKDDLRLSQNLIINSIVEWDIKDATGNVVPITIKALLDNVPLTSLGELATTARQVNNLDGEEKNG